MTGVRGRVLAPLAVASLLLGACSSGSSAPATGNPSFSTTVTAPAAQEPVRVVAVGDIACQPGEATTPDRCQQAATAALARSLHPEAVMALGDLQYEDGTLDAFRSSYDASWGALKAITRPIPGNHEYHTDKAAGYFGYWDDPPGWYAWDAGAWRIYMLDSTCGDTDCPAEQAWLAQDLQANPAKCTAIALHYPRFSSGSEHGSNPTMNRFWKIAYAHGVDLALSGHEHTYERFAAMDPEGNLDPARGIISFVSGTGGKSLYGLDPRVPGSQFAQDTSFGVLLLTLAPTSFRWRFVDVAGATLDRGSAQCH